MGTVVFPKAEYKIFLTARPEVRAERRLAELQEKRPCDVKNMSREQMIQELVKRDKIDSTRTIAPLLCPKDAKEKETTEQNKDEDVARILEYYQKKNDRSAW